MFHNNTSIIAVIGAIFLIVSISALCIFFFVVAKQKSAFVAENQERAELEARGRAVQDLMQTLTETKEERDSLNSRILKEENVITLLSLIETIAKEQGVALSTESLTVEPINEVFETLIEDVTVQGSYTSIMQLLTLLEELPYQVSVSKVSIERETTNNWKGAFQIRVIKFKKS